MILPLPLEVSKHQGDRFITSRILLVTLDAHTQGEAYHNALPFFLEVSKHQGNGCVSY